MADCNQDCGGCSQNCDSRQAPQDLRAAPHELSHVKQVIGVVSGKGGVGKSLVTGLLAAGLSKRGLATAILDADITGPSIPQVFDLHTRAVGSDQGLYPVISAGGVKVMSLNLLVENETDPVLWRGPVIAGVVKQFWSDVIWDEVDCMLVDMPPGTGDVPLTVYQSLPIDGVIVVTSPQDLVSMVVTKAINMARTMDIPILGLVENYSYFKCPDCGGEHRLFGESKLDSIALDTGIPILGRLPIDPRLAEACDAGNLESLDVDYLSAAMDLITRR